MQKLFQKYYQKLDRVPVEFHRYLLKEVDWSSRLIGIKGARGSGKTTLLLQSIHFRELPQDHQSLYVSLDDLYFAENKLYDLADQFVREGGRFLFLDEVHRYERWSAELKNIYDDFLDLQVVFTGSSLLHLDQAKGDLSRRAIMYELWGLSFREYLHFKLNTSFEAVTLENILSNHLQLARGISRKIKPLAQ